MERKVWKFQIDEKSHEVALNWMYWEGFRQVVVDDRVVDTSQKAMRWRSEQRVEIDGHAVTVRTEPSMLVSPFFRITLELDGRVVPAEPVPRSKWER